MISYPSRPRAPKGRRPVKLHYDRYSCQGFRGARRRNMRNVCLDRGPEGEADTLELALLPNPTSSHGPLGRQSPHGVLKVEAALCRHLDSGINPPLRVTRLG